MIILSAFCITYITSKQEKTERVAVFFKTKKVKGG